MDEVDVTNTNVFKYRVRRKMTEKLLTYCWNTPYKTWSHTSIEWALKQIVSPYSTLGLLGFFVFLLQQIIFTMPYVWEILQGADLYFRHFQIYNVEGAE